MKLKMKSFVGVSLMMALVSCSVLAQETMYRMYTGNVSGLDIAVNSSTSDETYIVGSGPFTIPAGQVETSDGTVLTSEQVSRLQEIIDNDLFEFLNLKVSNTPYLYYHEIAANPNNEERVSLPKELPIDMAAVFGHGSTTYSGDVDTIRVYVTARDGDGNAIGGTLYDSGHVNWSDTYYYRTSNITVPAGAQEIKFNGACHRYVGNYCSGDVKETDVIFNSDLPAVGDVITIK